ncbi:MAG: heme biosynthesis protein HemY [Betaproteobacteria bacterium]|nr:heme biosynthesis protein HemY [Betaproteobacteria bacterium]
MRSLLWLLALFAAAVALAIVGRNDTGYVLFVYPPYRVEMSMVLFAVGCVLAFVAVYGAARLLSRALELPAQVRAYRLRKRGERAQGAFAAALHAYYEGRYARAAKDAELAYEGGAAPGLSALLAARAAHQLRDFPRRSLWLERAERAGAEIQTALAVTRAELALEERDYATAREALHGMHGSGPKHIATLRLLLRAERGAGAWEEVLRLATQLAKRDAISPALAEEYRTQATLELLKSAAGSAADFERRWRNVPAEDQVKPRLAAAAAREAAELGRPALAREILERALAREWSADLVAAYGELPGSLEPAARQAEARARIERAEAWLRSRSRDAQLLAALGTLCVDAELWGKAASFLEASLSFEETRAARLQLARLAERLGRASEAQAHFRRAAEQV